MPAGLYSGNRLKHTDDNSCRIHSGNLPHTLSHFLQAPAQFAAGNTPHTHTEEQPWPIKCKGCIVNEIVAVLDTATHDGGTQMCVYLQKVYPSAARGGNRSYCCVCEDVHCAHLCGKCLCSSSNGAGAASAARGGRPAANVRAASAARGGRPACTLRM